LSNILNLTWNILLDHVFLILFSTLFRLKMTAVALFRPPAAPAILAQVPPWHLVSFLLVGVGLLSFITGTMVYWLCYMGRQKKTKDPPTQDEALLDTACWPSSGHQHLHWSRLPREEIPLATFVTRRPNAWQHLQARGHDCVLMID
jgi:hypothetical protein